MVFDHCRSSSGNPWIGLHDANDNDVFVWLNGNILPDDDENWRNGCIFLIVVIIFKGLYYIIRDFRPGPYSARSVNFVLNKTVLLRDRKSRTAHALCLVISKLFIRPKKKIWKGKKKISKFFSEIFFRGGEVPPYVRVYLTPPPTLCPITWTLGYRGTPCHLDLGLGSTPQPPLPHLVLGLGGPPTPHPTLNFG